MKFSTITALIVFSLGFIIPANAALTTIGTAQFGGTGTEYNLIWDDDNNGNSVVWLDYTNSKTTWTAQNSWAAGLDDASLIINLVGYTVDWETSSWRLPKTVDGPYEFGYDGTTTAGYNITTSEMGHLYYEELENLGYYDTSHDGPQSGWGLQNIGPFDHLDASWPPFYWSDTNSTDYPNDAWAFSISFGGQYSAIKSDSHLGGFCPKPRNFRQPHSKPYQLSI